MKSFICALCEQEQEGNVNTDNSIICWLCVQRLLQTPPEKIQLLYQGLIEKGRYDKAKLIENWLPKEEYGKTQKYKRDIVRKKIGRMVGIAHN